VLNRNVSDSNFDWVKTLSDSINPLVGADRGHSERNGFIQAAGGHIDCVTYAVHILDGHLHERTDIRTVEYQIRLLFAICDNEVADDKFRSLRPPGHIPITPFIRWDEKAGLRRDAIRSQRLTRSRRNGKETGL
jgi:hypothetical protein